MNENELKYANYKEQFKRLNRAITQRFNLEAMFIAYSIMEDRTESILRHAGKFEKYLEKREGKLPTIESKIKEIQKCRSNRKDLMFKYFSDDLLDKILDWKNERNRMVHALLKQKLTAEELDSLALQGKEFARQLSDRATNYRRALERANKDSSFYIKQPSNCWSN